MGPRSLRLIPGALAVLGFALAPGGAGAATIGLAGLVAGGPADNGGRTGTIAIEGSSPAKNLVPKGKCEIAKGEDQRGFERPKGPRCDAGAYERGAKP